MMQIKDAVLLVLGFDVGNPGEDEELLPLPASGPWGRAGCGHPERGHDCFGALQVDWVEGS